MDQLKYIIIDRGWFEVVIFTNTMEHAYMATRMGVTKAEIVGAGFLQITSMGAQCYGSSFSLGIGSRGEVDSAIVNQQAGYNVG